MIALYITLYLVVGLVLGMLYVRLEGRYNDAEQDAVELFFFITVWPILVVVILGAIILSEIADLARWGQ